VTYTRPRGDDFDPPAFANVVTLTAAEFADAQFTLLVLSNRTPAWTDRRCIALVTLNLNPPLAVVRAWRSCLCPDHRITARCAVQDVLDDLLDGLSIPPSIRADIRLSRTLT
jgi:hypothetical protein